MKKQVKIFVTNDFVIAKQSPIVKIVYDSETKEVLIENLDDKNRTLKDVLGDDEIIVGQDGKEYKPTDGMDFLKNLKYQFSGSNVRASDVENYQDESQ